MHLVHVARDGDEHRIRDLTGTHLTGDNAGVLPTDTQKNSRAPGRVPTSPTRLAS